MCRSMSWSDISWIAPCIALHCVKVLLRLYLSVCPKPSVEILQKWQPSYTWGFDRLATPLISWMSISLDQGLFSCRCFWPCCCFGPGGRRSRIASVGGRRPGGREPPPARNIVPKGSRHTFLTWWNNHISKRVRSFARRLTFYIIARSFDSLLAKRTSELHSTIAVTKFPGRRGWVILEYPQTPFCNCSSSVMACSSKWKWN